MKKLSLLLLVMVLAFSSCDWLFNSPVANAGSDKAIFLGESTTLYGSSGLTDESGVAYTWTTSSSSVTLGETNTATPSFTASTAGTYYIKLVVSNNGYEDDDTVTVTVKSSGAILQNVDTTEDSKYGTVEFSYDIKSMGVGSDNYVYMYAFYYEPDSLFSTIAVIDSTGLDIYDSNSTYLYSYLTTKTDYSLELDVDDFDLSPVDKVQPTLYVQLKISKSSTLTKYPISASYYDKSEYYAIYLDAYSRDLEDGSTPDFTVELVTDPDLIAQLDAGMADLEANPQEVD